MLPFLYSQAESEKNVEFTENQEELNKKQN